MFKKYLAILSLIITISCGNNLEKKNHNNAPDENHNEKKLSLTVPIEQNIETDTFDGLIIIQPKDKSQNLNNSGTFVFDSEKIHYFSFQMVLIDKKTNKSIGAEYKDLKIYGVTLNEQKDGEFMFDVKSLNYTPAPLENLSGSARITFHEQVKYLRIFVELKNKLILTTTIPVKISAIKK